MFFRSLKFPVGSTLSKITVRLFFLCATFSITFLSTHRTIAKDFPSKKIALLILGSDVGPLTNALTLAEEEARKVYLENGFEVISLGGKSSSGDEKSQSISPANLSRVLTQLRGVSDLRIDFHGHGGLGSSPSKDRHIPYRLNSSDEFDQEYIRVTGQSAPAFAAINLNSYQIGFLSRLFPGLIEKKSTELTIGVGDIRQAVSAFQRNNPSALTFISMLNCYSGMAAEQLSDLPRLAVFANSPALEPAIEIGAYEPIPNEPDQFYYSSNNGLIYYYNLGFEQSSNHSIGEAWKQARKKTEIFFSPKGFGNNIGRSPVHNYINAWCRAKPQTSAKLSRQQQDRNSEEKKKSTLNDIRENIISMTTRVQQYLSSAEAAKAKESYQSCLNYAADLKRDFEAKNEKLGTEDGYFQVISKTQYFDEVVSTAATLLNSKEGNTPQLIQDYLLNEIQSQRSQAQKKGVQDWQMLGYQLLEKEVKQSWPKLKNGISHLMQEMKIRCVEKTVSVECKELLLNAQIIFKALQDKNQNACEVPMPAGERPNCEWRESNKDEFCQKSWEKLKPEQVPQWKEYYKKVFGKERELCLLTKSPFFIAEQLNSIANEISIDSSNGRDCELSGYPSSSRATQMLSRELLCVDTFEQESSEEDWGHVFQLLEMMGHPAKGH